LPSQRMTYSHICREMALTIKVRHLNLCIEIGEHIYRFCIRVFLIYLIYINITFQLISISSFLTVFNYISKAEFLICDINKESNHIPGQEQIFRIMSNITTRIVLENLTC
jgi:hypothetical protein